MFRTIFALCTLSLALGACNDYEKAAQEVIEPDSKDALKGAFEKVVQAAKAKDEQAVLNALTPYLATEAEMAQLFGSDVAPKLFQAYEQEIVTALKTEGVKVIIEQVGIGRDELIVDQVGPAYLANTTPGDQKLLDAMVSKTPMYSVRFRRPGEKLGLRLNGFVYLNGQWKTLLKTYDHLPSSEADAAAEVPDVPPDDAPTPAEAAPTPEDAAPSAAEVPAEP